MGQTWAQGVGHLDKRKASPCPTGRSEKEEIKMKQKVEGTQSCTSAYSYAIRGSFASASLLGSRSVFLKLAWERFSTYVSKEETKAWGVNNSCKLS